MKGHDYGAYRNLKILGKNIMKILRGIFDNDRFY